MKRALTIAGRPVVVEDHVEPIVRAVLGGAGQAEVALQHGVTRQYVHQVVHGSLAAGARLVAMRTVR